MAPILASPRPRGTLSAMDKQAAIRRARIAVSVFFGVLTLVTCVLWVRSYWKADQLHFPLAGGSSCVVASKSGRVVIVSYQSGKHQWEAGRYAYPVNDNRSFPVGDVCQYEAAFGFGTLKQPRFALPPPPAPSLPSVTLPVFAALHRAANRGIARTLPGAGVLVPYWSVVTPVAAVVGVLCFKRPQHWHFSLRAMLIATTLVAVVLGLGMWLAK
jgi:hypothetical protein